MRNNYSFFFIHYNIKNEIRVGTYIDDVDISSSYTYYTVFS